MYPVQFIVIVSVAEILAHVWRESMVEARGSTDQTVNILIDG